MIEVQVLTNLISNVGFPIVVVVYMFTRFEKKITENTKAMNQMILMFKGFHKK